MTPRRIELLGDGIENPGNALAMVHAARMYGAECRFRDTRGLAADPSLAGAGFSPIADEALQHGPARRIAFDNLSGAAEVYSFRPGPESVVMMGNERRGLSYECRRLATDAVQIPMLSRRINCLNVAAASAVALHYLSHVHVGPMSVGGHPARRRPDLLIVGRSDHVELGSALRSAAAFGWERVLLEDRGGVWFDCDRVVRSEGRAAARRGRNDIRLVRCPPDARFDYPDVVVVTAAGAGPPLPRVSLAGGPGQLVVLADEGAGALVESEYARLGRHVRVATLDLPRAMEAYHFRLLATVALAEVARQVGRRQPGERPARPTLPVYDRGLARAATQAGELVRFSDLLAY